VQLRRPTHRISTDGSERRIAPKALGKFKTQIRDMTRRTRGISLPQLIEKLKPYLLGWRGYFGFCQTPRVLTNLEAWIRRRLRSYLWRQWRNGHTRFSVSLDFLFLTQLNPLEPPGT
jgi:RNA-directed DNA polymerase